MSVHRRLLLGGGGGSFVMGRTLLGLFNGKNGVDEYEIGAASFDGSTWTEAAGNPIFSAGSGWEADGVKDPHLMYAAGGYVMYYRGYVGATAQIGRATATSHEGPWTREASNPVIPIGAGGTFDDTGTGFPNVIYDPTDTGREWKMWYAADDGSGGDASAGTAYAYSSDGVTWTKFGIVLAPAGSGWEMFNAIPLGIVKTGGTYYLFYGSRADTSQPFLWQGGVATFTDPEGTYTRFAGNPTLLGRWNDAGTSQALTANASAGASSVAVASTSAFNVGEAVSLTDGDSETEIHTISAIPSGTQIDFAEVLANNFTTAQTARLRPFTRMSVVPKTVLAAPGGGWEMYLTPFQPFQGTPAGGTLLREGALRATAANLTDDWAYDYVTGLIFPLYPADTGWHEFSAENLSVIVAP